MRQLKGKVKETNKQKKERKKEFLENKQRVFTIVLPTVGVLFVLMVLYVYFKASRPKISVEYWSSFNTISMFSGGLCATFMQNVRDVGWFQLLV